MKTFNQIDKINESHEDINPEILSMTVGELLEKLSSSSSEEALAAYHIIETGINLANAELSGEGYDNEDEIGEPNTVEDDDHQELDGVNGNDNGDFPTFGEVGSDKRSGKGSMDDFSFNG